MTGRGRYKASEWSEFESVSVMSCEPGTADTAQAAPQTNTLGQSKTSKVNKVNKQRCKHCKQYISAKIERLREHLKKCAEYSKARMRMSRSELSSDSDECLELDSTLELQKSQPQLQDDDDGEQLPELEQGEGSSTSSTMMQFQSPIESFTSPSCSTSRQSSDLTVTDHDAITATFLDSFVTSTPSCSKSNRQKMQTSTSHPPVTSSITSRSPSVTSLTSSVSSVNSVDELQCTGNMETPRKKLKTQTILPSIDRFVQRTSEAEKKLLDLQFARMVYSCNIPFSVAENKHMTKLIAMLRGSSYENPTRHQLSTVLLDAVYTECKTSLLSELNGQIVTLIQDGWSNIHNNPIIASCLHNGKKSFFIRSVDSGSDKKTAEYCAGIAEKEIDYCEEIYKCHVS